MYDQERFRYDIDQLSGLIRKEMNSRTIPTDVKISCWRVPAGAVRTHHARHRCGNALPPGHCRGLDRNVERARRDCGVP